MTDRQLLPKFRGARGGSGCDNPDCDAKQRHIRVLSEFETERMYTAKDTLPQWPFPPQATHACEKCGYCYQGVAGQVELPRTDADSDRPDVDLENWDWDPDMVYETTVREAIEALFEGAPRDHDGELLVGADELSEAVYRYVPGAGVSDAEKVMDAMDLDVVVHDLAEYM